MRPEGAFGLMEAGAGVLFIVLSTRLPVSALLKRTERAVIVVIVVIVESLGFYARCLFVDRQ